MPVLGTDTAARLRFGGRERECVRLEGWPARVQDLAQTRPVEAGTGTGRQPCPRPNPRQLGAHLRGRAQSVRPQSGRSSRFRSRLETSWGPGVRRRCSRSAPDDTRRCTATRRSVLTSVSARSKRELLGTRRCSPLPVARCTPHNRLNTLRKPACFDGSRQRLPPRLRNFADEVPKIPHPLFVKAKALTVDWMFGMAPCIPGARGAQERRDGLVRNVGRTRMRELHVQTPALGLIFAFSGRSAERE